MGTITMQSGVLLVFDFSDDHHNKKSTVLFAYVIY